MLKLRQRFLPTILLIGVTGCGKANTTPQAATPGQQNDKDAPIVLERFKVGRHGEALLLPVSLNGKAFQFLLDTGANVTVYDSALPLGAAKRTNKVNSPAGLVEIQFFNAPDAKIGKLKLRTAEEIAGFDQGKLREVTGHEIYGVVGMDFLKNHVVEIDFDEGEVRFLKSVGRDAGKQFRLFFQNGQPSTPVTGSTSLAGVATGRPDTVLRVKSRPTRGEFRYCRLGRLLVPTVPVT